MSSSLVLLSACSTSVVPRQDVSGLVLAAFIIALVVTVIWLIIKGPRGDDGDQL